MRIQIAIVAAALGFTQIAGAQTAPDRVAMGDQAHAALDAASALQHYEAALAADSMSYEALWKASREAVDLGEFDPDAAKRTALYRKADGYARRAVAANPDDAEGHFVLARALGRTALSLGTRDRIKYATEVRAQALEALRLDSTHAGALHVMGVWNAEVMRLSGFSRMMAKNFLGGKVFGEASWDNAQRYMERAVAVDPERLTHRLDLGRVYADRGQREKARAEFQRVVDGTPTDYNDANYKREAERALTSLD